MDKSQALTRAHTPRAVRGFDGAAAPLDGPKGNPFELVMADEGGDKIYAVESTSTDVEHPTDPDLKAKHWSNSTLDLDSATGNLANGTNYIQTHGTVYVYSRTDPKRDMRDRVFSRDEGY